MCGRYQLALAGKNKLFGYRFKVDRQQTLKIKDSYNIAPSQIQPVVVKHSPNTIRMMTWGLIPAWSKDGRSLTINARAETVSVKPMFKKLLRTQRCLIPATGFYEWKRGPDGKQPFYIGTKDRDFFGFAGLYDVWKDPKDEEIYSYAIITCGPNKTMSEIHNRMPVILNKNDEEDWLNPDTVEPEKLLPFLKSYPDNLMTAYPIYGRINSPANNDSNIDQPLALNSA